MNVAGDYSVAYCMLQTDSPHAGHGMVPLPIHNAQLQLIVPNADIHHRPR